jgi:plasmid stabilization system protein ParE
MEEEKKLPVKVSKLFLIDLNSIFQYGVETFGLQQAELYENEIWKLVEGLSSNWLLFSECRHLPTKSKMYRWIVLESHLIIYRITIKEVQVLRILHSNRSITKIRTSRGVRL